MKKYFLFIVILLLISISKITYSQVAQCFPGFISNFIFANYPIPNYGDCNVLIEYCCKWDPVNKRVDAYFNGFNAYSSCMLYITDWDIFMKWINAQIAASDFCYEYFPPCDEPEAGWITKVVHIAQCNYFENKLPPAPGENEYFLHLYPCGYGNECIYYYRTCYDWQIHDWVTEFDHSEIVGTPDCPLTVPELPPQGKTWNEYWITRCFAKQCE